jgi:uncharacterized membrane protein YccC
MNDFLTRLIENLSDELRTLSVSGPRARTGLRTALAGVLSLLFALSLNLDDPWWAAITGFVMVQGDVAATFSRSVDRAVGTIVGAVIGYLAVATIADHALFLLICAISTAFAIYGQERVEHGYAILLGGVTIILFVMFGALAAPEEALHLAVYRALEILVGVVVACLVDYALAEQPSARKGGAGKPGIWTLPVDRELAVVAITGGIAIALIPMTWESLQLPGLAQTPITAFVILISMRQEPAWKAVTRAAGCLLGGLYGLLMMHLVGDAFLLWLFALAAGLFACAHIRHGDGDASYVGLQAGVAIIMAMVQGQAPSPDILPAVDRLIGILGGILVVGVCQPLVTPLVRSVIGAPGRRW